jgi:hypothetical protein
VTSSFLMFRGWPTVSWPTVDWRKLSRLRVNPAAKTSPDKDAGPQASERTVRYVSEAEDPRTPSGERLQRPSGEGLQGL